MQIPRELNAGDSWSWSDSLADYPAPTWVLTYYFRGPKTFNVVATASGSDHASAVPAATSTTYPRGTYSWQAQAVNGTTKVTVETGRLTINPDLSNASIEHRSFNQRCLDDLETAITNGAIDGDVLTYNIGGRSQTFRDWDEILATRDKFRLKVAGELGLKPGRVLVRFGQP